MRKILSILILIFLVGLIAVNAEKVDIANSIKEYILDNYKEIKLTETSIIFYYNPDICPDYEASKSIIEGLVSEGYNIPITIDYFTSLSAGSLAICMNDYSTRINIKPEEIKEYADYCKNFKVPSGGIFTVVPKKEKEEGELNVMSLMGLEYKAVDEDIAYILPWPGLQYGFTASLDNNNPKVREMSQQERDNLMFKVESFVINRVWGSTHKYGRELINKEDEFLEEINSLGSEDMKKKEELYEEVLKIRKAREELNALEQRAIDETNMDLLKDYSEPYEGEVVDGFTIRKGDKSQTDVDFINVPKERPKNLPAEYYDLLDKRKAKEGGWADAILIFAQIDSAYVFAEDEKPETQPEETLTEDEEKTIEEKPAVEEQPVKGINRITNSIKKLFAGEPEKTEETPQQQPGQPEKEDEKFLKKVLCKILHPFSNERYTACLID